MLVQEYRIISEEGVARDGFFVDRFVIGFIIGCLIGACIACIITGFTLVDKQNEIDSIHKHNYVIPKSKALGLYLQMPDGKLYKRQ